MSAVVVQMSVRSGLDFSRLERVFRGRRGDDVRFCVRVGLGAGTGRARGRFVVL